MLRRLLLPLALASALCARAQSPTEITGETTVVDTAGVKITQLRMTDGELLLTARQGLVSADRLTITASDNVVLTYRAIRVLADKLVYQRKDGSFTAEHVRLGAFPYFAEGESASGTLKEITLVHATATYGEPSSWHPTLVADKIIYAPGQHLRTENSRLGIGHVQPVPLTHLTHSLRQSLAVDTTLLGGVDSRLGAYLDATVLAPVAEGWKLGGAAGLYSRRGLLVGPAADYARDDADGREMRGGFRSGYINDHGDKRTDALGQPVPENRAFVAWEHRQVLGPDLTLTAQLNWWRDSEVLRDFRPREFFPVQQPDTFAEATYAGKNYFVSLFTRLHPNNFERVQERLPELRFDLLPTAIGGGFYERFNASAAILREEQVADGLGSQFVSPTPPIDPSLVIGRPPTLATPAYTSFLKNGPAQRAARFDAYYSLSRPVAIGDWFALTPVAGARFTHYASPQRTTVQYSSYTDPRFPLPGTINSAGLSPVGDSTRTLGELGFDAAVRASGVFDYKNDTWKIDDLRHLVTPRLSYRYIPNDGKNLSRIPTIDRDVFATYLPPLGLGDARAVDSIASTNVLRVGLDNTLQTRDPVYGSRDLVTLNLSKDFRLSQRYFSRYNSDVHAELAVTPARWLEASVYGTVEPRNLKLNECNSAITLRDGDDWSVRVANNFLRGPRMYYSLLPLGHIHDYAVDGRFRLHERFDALAKLHYDARRRRFTEQAYGLMQNLDNTWRISYVVSLYEGRARESHIGLRLQVDAIGF